MSPAPSSRAVGPDAIAGPPRPRSPGVAGAGTAEGVGATASARRSSRCPEQVAAGHQPGGADDDEQRAEGTEAAPDEPS